MGNTSIEWTDSSWNPVRGCSRVSEGCRNCYAERIAVRFSKDDLSNHNEGDQPFHGFAIQTNSGPRWTGKVELIESKLHEPLHWKKPRRVFVNSMSDLFHENLSDWAIDRVFAVMAICPQHTFQVLTKRPERMQKWFQGDGRPRWDHVYNRTYGLSVVHQLAVPAGWPLPNIWLGVSVENRATKGRIDILRDTPAALRFLSIEPLLEDIGELDLRGIDWVIVGGESGPGARPMRLNWVRGIRRQCQDAGVPLFVKQLGSRPVGESSADLIYLTSIDSRKGGDWENWPPNLRIRQFPVIP